MVVGRWSIGDGRWAMGDGRWAFEIHDQRFEIRDVHMTIELWLKAAIDDAERRGLPGLKPLLEGLAQSTKVLRSAQPGGQAHGPAQH